MRPLAAIPFALLLIRGCRNTPDCGGELVYDSRERACRCPAERPTYSCPTPDECFCIAAAVDGGIDDSGTGGADDAGSDGGCAADLGTLAACTGCGDVCGWDCEPAGCNDAIALAAGQRHACALREQGDVVCWGRNSSGELGIGMVSTSAPLPLTVASLDGVSSISSRVGHTCAVLRDGDARCWGDNSRGQVGDGTTADRASPVSVALSSGVVAIGAGYLHTCAVMADATVRCWGEGSDGQLGNASRVDSSTPVPVSTLSSVRSVGAGAGHTCALRDDGTVWCWGSNMSGEIGHPSAESEFTPVRVSALSNVSELAVGAIHNCALVRTDGSVWCWGSNDSGQLGNGGGGVDVSSATPTMVAGLLGATSISTGWTHTCAVLSDGTVRCWGQNAAGGLGNGSTTSSPVPVEVADLTDAVGVSCGDQFTCAQTRAGAVRCWGNNGSGQLADGSTTSRTSPGAAVAP